MPSEEKNSPVKKLDLKKTQVNEEITEKSNDEAVIDKEVAVKGNRKKAITRILIFLAVVIVILLIYGIYWLKVGKWEQDTEDAYINGYQNVVTSQLNGRITQIYIKDTQEVKEGDLLAVVDDTDYKINFEKAEAALAKAVKGYYSLSSSAYQYVDIVSAKESDLRKAQADYARDSSAYKQGLISKEQYDITSHDLEQAKTALAKSRKEQENARVQAILSSIYTHPNVKEAIVNYKEAYINLERTKIYAPISGIIAKKSIYLGQKVASNQELLTIIDPKDIWVDGNLKENQLKSIKIGNEVEIVSDVNQKKYKGYITGISAGTGNAFSILPAQNATGNWIKIVQRVPIRIDIEKESLENNGALPLGSSATITVNTKVTGDIAELNKKPEQKTELYKIDENDINHRISQIIEANIGRR